MKNYACDFETACDNPNKTYVWAWGCTEITTDFEDRFKYGTSILSFFEMIMTQQTGQESRRYWFHNLKFDGSFIVNFLLSAGFMYDDRKFKDMSCQSFNTTISGQGQWYRIRVKNYGVKIEFCNSLMKLQSSIDKLGKDLGYEIKGQCDYSKHREEFADDLSPNDLEYLKLDVCILAHAMLTIHVNNGTSGLTIGSDCLREFKKMVNFERLYPQLDLETDTKIRKAYVGGYVNKKEKNRYDYGEGFIADINSMYPYVMHSKSGYKHPYGEPKFFEGEFVDEEDGYDLYVQRIYVARAVLKSGNYFPTINIKRKFNTYGHAEYSRGFEDVELTLSMYDLFWFTYNYNVDYISIDGYKFKSTVGIFDKYIDKYYAVKEQATKDKNESMRAYAKLMQNNLYGKLASNPIGAKKIPYLKDGIIKYHTYENNMESVYIPAGVFITSYARNELFKAIVLNYDRWIYCDTDCIQCEGRKEDVQGLKIDKYELGAWDIEAEFTQGKYLRAKTYAYKSKKDGKWKFKCAGLPKDYQAKMDISEFYIGSVIKDCKLKPVQINGGTLLVTTDFTIQA